MPAAPQQATRSPHGTWSHLLHRWGPLAVCFPSLSVLFSKCPQKKAQPSASLLGRQAMTITPGMHQYVVGLSKYNSQKITLSKILMKTEAIQHKLCPGWKAIIVSTPENRLHCSGPRGFPPGVDCG